MVGGGSGFAWERRVWEERGGEKGWFGCRRGWLGGGAEVVLLRGRKGMLRV